MWKRGRARLLRHRQTKGPDSARPHLNRRATPRLHLKCPAQGQMSVMGMLQQQLFREECCLGLNCRFIFPLAPIETMPPCPRSFTCDLAALFWRETLCSSLATLQSACPSLGARRYWCRPRDPAHSHDPRRRPATRSAIISFEKLSMRLSSLRCQFIASHKPDVAFLMKAVKPITLRHLGNSCLCVPSRRRW